MKKRFTKAQIIRILQEGEQADNIRQVCRRHNLTEQTFYGWRTKYGAMEVSEVKRPWELERENEELKKIVAQKTLDIRILGGLTLNLFRKQWDREQEQKQAA